jgi:HipA-like protein
MNSKFNGIVGVSVFAELRKSRIFVGVLTKEEAQYKFEYDTVYLHEKNAISIGPELPLTRKTFFSEKLFNSFGDRIPSKHNPAYNEYCAHVGIDTEESNKLILLSTIGHKGASSFIFEPLFKNSLEKEVLINFRKNMNLTVRDFAILFDFSTSSISKIEKGHSSGKDTLKRVEIYSKFAEVALFEIKKNRTKIHSATYKKVVAILKKQASDTISTTINQNG